MAAADQAGVAEGGGAAVSPGREVVALGPTGRSIAPRKYTTAIAEDEGAAQRAGEQPPGTTEVKGQAVAVENSGQDLRVAGKAAGFGGTDRGSGIQPTHPATAAAVTATATAVTATGRAVRAGAGICVRLGSPRLPGSPGLPGWVLASRQMSGRPGLPG